MLIALGLWLGLTGFSRVYGTCLDFCLQNKLIVILPALLLWVVGATVWLGFGAAFAWLPEPLLSSRAAEALERRFPGLGREFMPSLDEGSFLYMPTLMTHASVGEAADVLSRVDRAISQIPEVSGVVGKIGRAETPLDPAPLSMIETMISVHPEYALNERGRRIRYRVDGTGELARDERGELIPDRNGRPRRLWRDSIRTREDIWAEIDRVAQLPGLTAAPMLQPIETRLVMLQSGFRAPIGIKVFGPDLQTIDTFGLELQQLLKEAPGVAAETVFADRVVGKPYLEIEIDRGRLARHGIHVNEFQDTVEVAIGGRELTTTVEGRERYPVRVRYQRELRDRIDTLGDILIASQEGRQVPLRELADIEYVRGPQMIRAEDTFLVSYVLFDKQLGWAEVEVVESAQRHLDDAIASGRLRIPEGVSYRFAGTYENQVRASERLSVVLPTALILILVVLYLKFRSIALALMVFSGVFVAWSGGFLMIWLYGQAWFLNLSIAGVDLRELFNVEALNLSVAVWVGFLALFGIATDDGVVMGTRLQQAFGAGLPDSVAGIRRLTIQAAQQRVRACLVTTGTTVLALLPLLTSGGRGSDVMLPMAIPTIGGMSVALLSLFLVPVLFSAVAEGRLLLRRNDGGTSRPGTP